MALLVAAGLGACGGGGSGSAADSTEHDHGGGAVVAPPASAGPGDTTTPSTTFPPTTTLTPGTRQPLPGMPPVLDPNNVYSATMNGLTGAALQANYAFGPLSGAAVNITLLSNIDDLHIGVNSDPAAVADPALLLECLSEGFEEVRKTA